MARERGRSRQILTHLGVEQHGGKEENFGAEVRGAFGEEIGRGGVAAGAVFAGEVEEVLVGGRGGEEVRGVVETFQIEELGFDRGVAAFDIGIGVGVGRRVEAVSGADGREGAVKTVGTVVDGVAVELGAEVGADDQLGEVEAVRGEVGQHALERERGVGFREFAGVAQEERAERFAANGVLEAGHAGLLHLGEVVGNVVEVFGVHLQA